MKVSIVSRIHCNLLWTNLKKILILCLNKFAHAGKKRCITCIILGIADICSFQTCWSVCVFFLSCADNTLKWDETESESSLVPQDVVVADHNLGFTEIKWSFLQVSHYYFLCKSLRLKIQTIKQSHWATDTVDYGCLAYISVYGRKRFVMCVCFPYILGLCYDSVWINSALYFKSVDLCSLECSDDRSRLAVLAELTLDLQKWSWGRAACEMERKTKRKPKREKGFVSRHTDTGQDKNRVRGRETLIIGDYLKTSDVSILLYHYYKIFYNFTICSLIYK